MSLLMTSTLRRLRALPLLSVAAVDGNAIGGGAEECLPFRSIRCPAQTSAPSP